MLRNGNDILAMDHIWNGDDGEYGNSNCNYTLYYPGGCGWDLHRIYRVNTPRYVYLTVVILLERSHESVYPYQKNSVVCGSKILLWQKLYHSRCLLLCEIYNIFLYGSNTQYVLGFVVPQMFGN